MIDAPAKIGSIYRVPCLHLALPFMGESWVPVIGPKHRDAELKFDHEHFHIDWRFVSVRMFAIACGATLDSPHRKVITNDTGYYAQRIDGTPQLKRRKCKRDMPIFPSARSMSGVWSKMEAAQRKRCDHLKDGHTCPHRGIDLRPFVQPDGTAICPGHGLRWDMTTGKMIAHHGAAA